jgi:SMI1-KNR4 cell-wall
MNKTQLDLAECLLAMQFPHPYRRFMESLSDDGRTARWEEPTYIQIINHPELLAVTNLELREVGPRFAGAPWPKDYLAIGDDGCGNSYCLALGNQSTASLLLYDHDPEDDLIEVDASYAAFFQILARYQPEFDDCGVSNRIEKGLIVTRAAEPWQSILNPISLDEWSGYVGTDSALKYLGYREQTNPFTRETTRIHWPGYAVWDQADEPVVPIEYRSGRITMKGQSARCVETMGRIAGALNARLFGANGEELVVQ